MFIIYSGAGDAKNRSHPSQEAAVREGNYLLKVSII